MTAEMFILHFVNSHHFDIVMSVGGIQWFKYTRSKVFVKALQSLMFLNESGS